LTLLQSGSNREPDYDWDLFPLYKRSLLFSFVPVGQIESYSFISCEALPSFVFFEEAVDDLLRTL